MSYVILDAGDSPIGAGQRYCVVTEGRKYAHLYYVPTCTGFSVSLAQYRAMKPAPLIPGQDYSPKKLRKKIRARRKLFEALGVKVSEGACDKALSTLKVLQ